MYKAAIRALMRHSIQKLTSGDYSTMLKMASPDFALAFPGENSWATMFRPAHAGREPHITHQGIDEARAFAERFVNEGVQFVVEDILVNGGPWNTRTPKESPPGTPETPRSSRTPDGSRRTLHHAESLVTGPTRRRTAAQP